MQNNGCNAFNKPSSCAQGTNKQCTKKFESKFKLQRLHKTAMHLRGQCKAKGRVVTCFPPLRLVLCFRLLIVLDIVLFVLDFGLCLCLCLVLGLGLVVGLCPRFRIQISEMHCSVLPIGGSNHPNRYRYFDNWQMHEYL